MPSEEVLYRAVAAGVTACLGLWWFHLFMKKLMARQPALARAGIYAAIWLAYFILTMMALALREGEQAL